MLGGGAGGKFVVRFGWGNDAGNSTRAVYVGRIRGAATALQECKLAHGRVCFVRACRQCPALILHPGASLRKWKYLERQCACSLVYQTAHIPQHYTPATNSALSQEVVPRSCPPFITHTRNSPCPRRRVGAKQLVRPFLKHQLSWWIEPRSHRCHHPQAARAGLPCSRAWPALLLCIYVWGVA